MGAPTPFPTPAAIARAELFTRERFVYEGESLEEALAPGSPRRRALDAAVAEKSSENVKLPVLTRRLGALAAKEPENAARLLRMWLSQENR